MSNLQHPDIFEQRHIGPDPDELTEMLNTCKVNSLDDLIDETIPKAIRLKNKLNLGDQLSEYNFINHLNSLASKNKILKNYIGIG